ncbi:hypothetical protein [Pseudomonas sp. 18175]|uniref:hypothetical protein n=1 Tax=Pseudomonas sp. 18175 TaxID=3390056 RepID=UPI003D1C32EE
MASQHFNGPVGQVVGGNNYNQGHSRWDRFSAAELKGIKSKYARERTRTVIGEYINKYALGLLITLIGMGFWGTYMIKTSGLTGPIPDQNLAVLAAFVVAIAIFGLGLAKVRSTASTTIAELDDDLKGINQAIRLKKTQR